MLSPSVAPLPLPAPARTDYLKANVQSAESKFIDRKRFLSSYTSERALLLHEKEWDQNQEKEKNLDRLKAEAGRVIPFLRNRCGIELRGRVLEIGAGFAWLSAEVSKQPRVVEVITTDVSRKALKDEAPEVFRILKAKQEKIVRTPGDYHKLDFPRDYFDFIVGSGTLHLATNPVQVLREMKRILKPGGKFIAIGEPVQPMVYLRRRKNQGKPAPQAEAAARALSLLHYRECFRQAALPLKVIRLNLSRGFRFYLNQIVNGLTHAHYALVGTKGVGKLSD